MESPPKRFAQASWIRSACDEDSQINVRYEYRQQFELSETVQAHIYITADSRYRLWVNGHWLSDGPARSYPDLAYYDTIPVTLPAGENLIEVELLYWGVDTFQYLRGPGGLIAETHACGQDTPLLVTDESWLVRRQQHWPSRVPRISCQQGFEEHYDARTPDKDWTPAVRYPSCRRELLPRETGPLSRFYRSIERVIREERVREISGGWSFSLRLMFSPFPHGINLNGMAGALSARFHCESQVCLRLYLLGNVDRVWVDGSEVNLTPELDLKVCELSLEAAPHRIGIAIYTENYQSTELSVGWEADAPVQWETSSESADSPWLTSGPLWDGVKDTNCFMSAEGPAAQSEAGFATPFGGSFMPTDKVLWQQTCQLAQANDMAAFRPLREEKLHTADAYLSLRTDQCVEPNATLPDILPPGSRITYDLGELTVGYLEFEIEAEEGACVDVFCFEHIENGQIQYLYQNGSISYRNSLRYTATAGHNVFCSRQRRGFRYVQIVVRNAPLRVKRLGVYEATYEPQGTATFECSDPQLNRIYTVSQRTLLLCMEDTFTDCPSYEQAYWLGDARNEALFARYAFGATDLIEHSLRLAAYSLNTLPIIASQCPSGWDVIIPSFSFLWGIAVWEAYWESGDKNFLRELYPALKQNLDVSLKYCTHEGLFSAPAWNFFDWTGIDQERETVLHNSLILAWALEAGAKAARAIDKDCDADKYDEQRELLAKAIEALWDDKANSYRDALLPDGQVSPLMSQHTSFLALIQDLIPDTKRKAALKNCLHLPNEMTGVGSPNAMYFLLEAILQEGYAAETLERLRSFWGAMLDAGATTFWEMLNPEGSDFPTRSHCHGWAAAPVTLLPRLFFDIRCLEPGWRQVEIRPRTLGLDYARVSLCTPQGQLQLEWQRQPNGEIETQVKAPPEMNVHVMKHYE